jgi:sugar lactone lactonase YvrE
MAVKGDRLYVAERSGLCEIDTETGEIVQRHAVEGARFPNDVAIDQKGRIYVSDSAGNTIYRSSGERFEVWVSGDAVAGPNGLFVRGHDLLVGNNGDHTVRAIDLETKETRTIVRFRSGIIDGIDTDGDCGYLVSHWEGRLYRVIPTGEVEKLLDTSTAEIQNADFEFVPGKNRIYVPTFMDDRVMTYRVGE